MILVKQRHFAGLKTWKSPRYGIQRVAQFSPWETIAKVDTLQDAQALILGHFIGLGQRAAFSQGKMVVNQQGRYL